MATKKQVMEEKSEEKEFVLEEAFKQLDDVMEHLEKDDITLEESFQLYQDGMKLIRACNQSIDKIEKQLIVLEEEGI